MRHYTRLQILVWLVAALFCATPCFAHKVNVFAYEEDGVIYCETMFSGGKPALHATISVFRLSSKQTLLTGKTDGQGKFSFPLSSISHNKSPLKIEVRCDDGHLNTWTLAPEEYLASAVKTSEQKTEESHHIAKSSPGMKEVLTGLGVIFCLGILIKFIQVRRKQHAK